jgi:aminomethyltransferase
MKYCLYGNDIDATTNPLEAGLGWIVKLDKDHFIGKEALAKVKGNLHRRLVCLEMIDRAIPRPGYFIFVDSEEVGVVTSGTQSPSLKKGIALAYLNLPWAKVGSEVEVQVRNRRQRAVVVKPPFYRQGTAHQ